MGNIVAMTSVSLDGMFEGPDHDIGWGRVDEELHSHFNEVLFRCGALLEGRVTHEMMAGFWPTADEDPDASPAVRDYAAFWRGVPKYVLSSTWPDDGRWSTTVVRSFDPVAVRALADSVEGDLMLGGGTVVEAARRAGLVDEYRIYVHPVLVGAGTPFLRAGHGRDDLRLLETRAFANGVVMLRHAVERGVPG